jgi:hypothetical protein
MASEDIYADVDTDEERQEIYQNLLKQYDKDVYDRRKSIRESYTRDLEHYRGVQLHEDKQFYKYTAMFAAGSFGVSFAFINNVVPFGEAVHKYVLITAWACLAAALVINIAIHRISAVIHGKYYDAVCGNIQRAYDGKPALEYKRWYTGWVMELLYWLDFASFLGGMACLIAFVVLNVK